MIEEYNTFLILKTLLPIKGPNTNPRYNKAKEEKTPVYMG